MNRSYSVVEEGWGDGQYFRWSKKNTLKSCEAGMSFGVFTELKEEKALLLRE